MTVFGEICGLEDPQAYQPTATRNDWSWLWWVAGLRLNRIVLRNHLMMFTIDLRCHPYVRTPLSHSYIAQPLKCCLQSRAAHVAW